MRSIHPLRVVLCAALALLLAASVLRATVVVPLTFTEVVRRADLVTFATVARVSEEYDAARGEPYRLVTFSALDVVKGAAAGAGFSLRFAGGPAPNGLSLRVSGVPRFEAGERVVLFAGGGAAYPCPLVGWWQGLYRVMPGVGGSPSYVADHAGRPVASITGGAGPRAVRFAAPPGLEPMTPAAFRSAVEARLQ